MAGDPRPALLSNAVLYEFSERLVAVDFFLFLLAKLFDGLETKNGLAGGTASYFREWLLCFSLLIGGDIKVLRMAGANSFMSVWISGLRGM